MNVFFDVHGTLVSAGVSRPYVRETFAELTRMGHDVYLWSSAGSSYAAQAAAFLGVEDLVAGCFSKSSPPPVSVDFAVDDHPHFGDYAITPFDGDPEDEELRKVVERLR